MSRYVPYGTQFLNLVPAPAGNHEAFSLNALASTHDPKQQTPLTQYLSSHRLIQKFRKVRNPSALERTQSLLKIKQLPASCTTLIASFIVHQLLQSKDEVNHSFKSVFSCGHIKDSVSIHQGGKPSGRVFQEGVPWHGRGHQSVMSHLSHDDIKILKACWMVVIRCHSLWGVP